MSLLRNETKKQNEEDSAEEYYRDQWIHLFQINRLSYKVTSSSSLYPLANLLYIHQQAFICSLNRSMYKRTLYFSMEIATDCKLNSYLTKSTFDKRMYEDNNDK